MIIAIRKLEQGDGGGEGELTIETAGSERAEKPRARHAKRDSTKDNSTVRIFVVSS